MSKIEILMQAMGRAGRAASRAIALAPDAQKNAALLSAAKHMRASAPALLIANLQDMEAAAQNGASKASLDRLKLDAARIEAIAKSLEDIAALKDPVGRELAAWVQPNGLAIRKIATPLGVIGVIFESRPNVTADAAALCLKSGNAVILRGGSDAINSAKIILAAMQAGLEAAGLPKAVVQLVPVTDRAAVGEMLKGLNGCLDVLVPRGGKSLVARVQSEARVPVFAHLDGNCHVYVHESADLAMAKKITLNAKLRRTGVCGSAETLLVDAACASTHLAPLVLMLLDADCEVRGCAETQKIDPCVKAAREEDWATEYLDAIIAVKVIEGLAQAIAHIERYGSHHTETIIAEDKTAAAIFQREVDSAIVGHNVSTQFADGGEFGFGAEIGIATGRMHARGPVGVEQLTSFKYLLAGDGLIRP